MLEPLAKSTEADKITRRLQELGELSRDLRRPRPVDMSSDAVGTRLRTLARLHRACRVLGEVGRRAGLGGGAG